MADQRTVHEHVNFELSPIENDRLLVRIRELLAEPNAGGTRLRRMLKRRKEKFCTLFEPMREEDQANQQNLPPMRAQDYSELLDWPGYFASVLGKGARETLVAALDSFHREGFTQGFGVDIAAGEGRDTLEMLHRGWRVLATDAHPDAFPHLWPRVPEALKSRLTTEQVNFAEMQIPDCDLVNASFALPFCEPRNFPDLWNSIVIAIRRRGRFAGQFFGNRDSWRSLPERTHHSRNEVLKLLEGFEIEMMNEEEKDDAPDVRYPKHWHLFHVVARKH